jgi:hypothetical protein
MHAIGEHTFVIFIDDKFLGPQLGLYFWYHGSQNFTISIHHNSPTFYYGFYLEVSSFHA